MLTQEQGIGTLRDLIIEDTGYDPAEEADFDWSTSERCDQCGEIAETALVRVEWDNGSESRLCGDCYAGATR